MAGSIFRRIHPPSKRHPKGLVRWQAILEMGPGPDPKTGQWRNRRQRRGDFPTRKEAQGALAQWQVEMAQGTLTARSDQTVAEMMEYWLDTYAVTKKPRTLADYRWEIVHHVVPLLGALKVQALEPRHITSWHADLRRGGKSPRAIRQAHLRLSQALDQALTHGLVPRNVAKIIAPPPKEEPPERTIWTPEQARSFLAVARSECIYGPIFRVSLATGMRRGELLGLRWRDVDWKEKALRIRQAVGPVQNKMTTGTPKGKRSERRVDVTDALLEDLREHRRRQNAQRLQLGALWHDMDLVFASEVGTAIGGTNLYREYRRLEELAGVPHIAIHDQRHTVASRLGAAGIDPRTAAERLGHDPKVLLGIYTHSSTEQRRRAAHALEDGITEAPAGEEERDAQ